MNNAVLAIDNMLKTSPAPQSTKSQSPKTPFPSIEPQPETQKPQATESSEPPRKPDNIKPNSTKKPENESSIPTDDNTNESSQPADVVEPQKEPQADQLATVQLEAALAAINLEPAAEPVTSEIVAKPVVELQQSPIGETAITGDTAAINTAQGQKEINPVIPEITTTQAQQPAQPQLLEETAGAQAQQPVQPQLLEETAGPQDQMPQSLVDQHVKAASELNPSAIAPDASKETKEAMAELLTPVAKETTVSADIIAVAEKSQPDNSQPNLTGDSTGRDMMQQQVPAEQATQPVRKENPGNALGLEIEHIVSQDGAQPQVTHLNGAPSVNAPNNAEAPSPPVQLPSPAQQIIESIHSMLSRDIATRQITIHLNPPELGKVSVEFDQSHGQITGLLKVASLQTRHEIEQALPEIIKNLEIAGVQVKRVEVVLTDQAQQEAFREHAHGHNPFAQHEFAQGRGAPGEPANPWLRSEGLAAADPESQMVVTDHSINMLV